MSDDRGVNERVTTVIIYELFIKSLILVLSVTSLLVSPLGPLTLKGGPLVTFTLGLRPSQRILSFKIRPETVHG